MSKTQTSFRFGGQTVRMETATVVAEAEPRPDRGRSSSGGRFAEAHAGRIAHDDAGFPAYLATMA